MNFQRRPSRRFNDAAQGLIDAWQQEANFRFECFVGALAPALGIAVGLHATEFLYLGIAVAFVLIAEMLNSAIERVVDLSSGGQWHELARQAKDMAAGAVLLASIHAVGVGLYLFAIIRPLATTMAAVRGFFMAQPTFAIVLFAIPTLVALAAIVRGQSARRVPK